MGVLEVLETYLIKYGAPGRVKLCKAVKRSPRTLDRWRKDGIPDAHDAFKLALACGLEEKEALRLAREEFPSEVAKEPA